MSSRCTAGDTDNQDLVQHIHSLLRLDMSHRNSLLGSILVGVLEAHTHIGLQHRCNRSYYLASHRVEYIQFDGDWEELCGPLLSGFYTNTRLGYIFDRLSYRR